MVADSQKQEKEVVHVGISPSAVLDQSIGYQSAKTLRRLPSSLDRVVYRNPQCPPNFASTTLWRCGLIAKFLKSLVDTFHKSSSGEGAHYGGNPSKAGDNNPHGFLLRFPGVLGPFHGCQRVAPRLEKTQVKGVDDVPRTVGQRGAEIRSSSGQL
jgi:hypothetical protein